MTKPYWRDSASEHTQFQLDTLLGSGLELGERLVRKHGEFYPFAFVWPTGGNEPELVSVLEGTQSEGIADSVAIIESTIDVLRNRRDELDGIALVRDLFVDGQSVVDVTLEHRDEINFAIYRHYRPRRVRRGATLGNLGGRPTKAIVWDFESGAGLRG